MSSHSLDRPINLDIHALCAAEENAEKVIDISDLLDGYDPLTDAIEDFVQVTRRGDASSNIAVDVNGSGNKFETIATVLTRLDTDEQALVNDGTLIVL